MPPATAYQPCMSCCGPSPANRKRRPLASTPISYSLSRIGLSIVKRDENFIAQRGSRSRHQPASFKKIVDTARALRRISLNLAERFLCFASSEQQCRTSQDSAIDPLQHRGSLKRLTVSFSLASLKPHLFYFSIRVFLAVELPASSPPEALSVDLSKIGFF